jgi:DNA polymerase-3 subunit epsilon
MSVLDGPLVFVDVETTGMSFSRGRVIEIGLLRVEHGEVTARFNSLVDPQSELPPFITGLTGITRDDLVGAPTFYDIHNELHDLLKDAVFVAHNVRFDYGFLKQEFKRVGVKFSPKQLCTVRLSKALYPAARGHKLQNLIDRYGIEVAARHRAFDDAQAMWHFIQHVQQNFPAPLVESAISRQIKSPSLPKGIDPNLIRDLPEGPGVYIFNDNQGRPLYIGKSVTIKKRVMSHFSADHEYESEFKISQQVADIKIIETNGELEALLLESQLVKDLQPLFNRQLRRRRKMTLARQTYRADGYISLELEDVTAIDPESLGRVLGVYPTKTQAKQFIDQILKDYGLCPKLMGLENGHGSCFSYQLKRCRGACAGKEDPLSYNQRLLIAFEGRRLQAWPYDSPVLIEEKTDNDAHSSMVVDQWCVVAHIQAEPDCEPVIRLQDKMFDIDTYKILRSYLSSKPHKLTVRPFALEKLQALTVV